MASRTCLVRRWCGCDLTKCLRTLRDPTAASSSSAVIVPRSTSGPSSATALADQENAHRELSRLSDAGLAIAIDDFGAGHSSLSRLHTLPIDVLKIDQSFVRGVARPGGRAAVASPSHRSARFAVSRLSLPAELS